MGVVHEHLDQGLDEPGALVVVPQAGVPGDGGVGDDHVLHHQAYASNRGGHLRYWARYFGISVLPQVAFFTTIQNTAAFEKIQNTESWMRTLGKFGWESWVRFFGILSLLKGPSKQQSWAFAVFCRIFIYFGFFPKIFLKYRIQNTAVFGKIAQVLPPSTKVPQYRSFFDTMPTSVLKSY